MTPPWHHEHEFGAPSTAKAERRTWAVILLTATAMVAEIAAGMAFNSMALLADGWHMASHAAALGISAFAYWFARKHRSDRRYAFGTAKVGALGGYTSAVVLALVALSMVWASVDRLRHPRPISFDESLVVAGLGLVINLLSAWLLLGGVESGGGHSHGHGGHAHGGHAHGGHGGDQNLRAAYLHVVADALTSVLAIVALLGGRLWGWNWLDPAMGLVGAALILRWARSLLRDTSHVLLDGAPSPELEARVRAITEGHGVEVVEMHLWHVGPDIWGAILTVESLERPELGPLRHDILALREVVHGTIEWHPRD